MKVIRLVLFAALLCMGCTPLHGSTDGEWTNRLGEPLVVISAPSILDAYYAEVFADIIAYDIGFADRVMGRDNIIILADAGTMPHFVGKVPDDVLLQADLGDIWIRDFSPLSPANPVKFVYAPNYLDRRSSREIDDSFRAFVQRSGLEFPTADLVVDGGNFVHNGADKAVLTERVLSDNPGKTIQEIESTLKDALGLSEIAFIPEQAGDTTGHSDGMVMWISEKVLLVNEYDEPFRSRVHSALDKALSDVTIIEVPDAYVPSVWKGFVSACGILVNALVTRDHIYVPTLAEDSDPDIVGIIRANTDKEVVAVDASGVCHMGGSVRCLSWQVWGEAADRLVRLGRE